jgi:fucose permease
MKEDLQLEGNEFSNIATAFFVAYLVAELPMGEHCDTSKSCQT